ncbi:MAG: M56 family metallopeptidase [Bryobacteraceae bacterium]|nr:M56 family metallopeptidase [Bryobacteraceae bacterium]
MNAFWEIVASNALMAFIMAAGVTLLGRLWRHPAALHVLWVLVLVKLVTPPAVTLPLALPAGEIFQTPATYDAKSDLIATSGQAYPVPTNDRAIAGGPGADMSVASSGIQTQGIDWLTLVGCAWCSGIIVLGLRRVRRILRFKRFLRQSQPLAPALLDMAEEVARRLGLRRVPQIGMLPVCVSPLVWSLDGRARIFLPTELFERLETAAQEAILAHELAHVRRKDHWVRLLEVVITTLFWWHPVVWWAARRLQELEDQCCDRMVMDLATHDARRYAAALLDTLDFLCEPAMTAPLGATAAKSSIWLRRRIAMLKDRSWTARLTFGRLMLLLAAAAIPMTVAFAAGPSEGQHSASEAPGVEARKAKETPAIEKRTVGKLVKDCHEKTDLSTPESAFAAFSRSVARRDIPAAVELSWVKLDPRSIADIEKTLKQDPGVSKDYQKQILETEIVEVLIYRGQLAAVITKSGLYPEQRAYAAMHFGKINGKWRNLDWRESGESFSPTIEAAEERFASKKDELWESFAKIREDVRNGRTPIYDYAADKDRQRPSLSASEREEIEQWRKRTWQLGIELDRPDLKPQAVQFAVFEKDPVPGFFAEVKSMRKHDREQLDKAASEARKKQLLDILMTVSWDSGFREVTGDELYLLTRANTVSSNSAGGKLWVVSKTVSRYAGASPLRSKRARKSRLRWTRTTCSTCGPPMTRRLRKRARRRHSHPSIAVSLTTGGSKRWR